METVKQGKRGFTLLELLAVIAILGTLLAILIPISQKAFDASKRVTCANNLRQLGTGIVLYAADNKKYPVGINTARGYIWIWPALLREYITGDTGKVDMFHCPSAPDESQWVVKFGSGLAAEDGYMDDEFPLAPGGKNFMSYGYNVWGAWAANGEAFEGLGVYKGQYWRGAASTSMVVKPSRMIAFGDSNWDEKFQGDRNWSGFIGMYAERQWPLEMHGHGANLVFCDGHVEHLPRTEFISQLNNGDAAKQKYCEKLWNRTHTNRRY